jgi:hypothetical protein
MEGKRAGIRQDHHGDTEGTEAKKRSTFNIQISKFKFENGKLKMGRSEGGFQIPNLRIWEFGVRRRMRVDGSFLSFSVISVTPW